MFPPSRYLAWAHRHFGKVAFDLATSGMPNVPLSELGVSSVASLDDPTGWSRARNAVAAHHGLPADEAVFALGTTYALWLAYECLASPGDEVLVEDPAYEPLLRIAEGVGARVVRFARHASEHFALDPDRIGRAMTPRTRVVTVTNLHNPTGVRAPDEVLRTIARIAQARGAHLVVDEVYAPFDGLVDDRGVFDGTARRLAPNIITVSSLTKCYGLGSSRLGWMLGPPEIVTRAEDAIRASCGSLPLSHAHIGVRAFECIGDLARRTRLALPGKRERVAVWAQTHGFEWSAPSEGIFGLVTLPGAGDLTVAIETIARDRDVLVAPGAFFGVPNAFRLAWSAPAAALEEGLTRLGSGLRAEIGPG